MSTDLRKKDRDLSGRWIPGPCTIMGTTIPCICPLLIHLLRRGLKLQTLTNLNILTRPTIKIQAHSTTKTPLKATKVCLQIITILMAIRCTTISTHCRLKKDFRPLRRTKAKIRKNLTTIRCTILGGIIRIICPRCLLLSKISRLSKILKAVQIRPIPKEKGLVRAKVIRI